MDTETDVQTVREICNSLAEVEAMEHRGKDEYMNTFENT